jgi:predicted DNA-binding transcriptional regulator AlpA
VTAITPIEFQGGVYIVCGVTVKQSFRRMLRGYYIGESVHISGRFRTHRNSPRDCGNLFHLRGVTLRFFDGPPNERRDLERRFIAAAKNLNLPITNRSILQPSGDSFANEERLLTEAVAYFSTLCVPEWQPTPRTIRKSKSAPTTESASPAPELRPITWPPLTPELVCEEFGIERPELDRMVKARGLPHFPITRNIVRFDRADVENFLSKRPEVAA